MNNNNHIDLQESFAHSIYFLGLSISIVDENNQDDLINIFQKVKEKINSLYNNLINDEIIDEVLVWFKSFDILEDIHSCACESASIISKKIPFWTRSDKGKLIDIYTELDPKSKSKDELSELMTTIINNLSYDLHDEARRS